MTCGPAADAVHRLNGATPAGKAPRRTKILLHAALLATTALVPVLLTPPTAAQTVNWDGSASNDWDTAGNWDTNAVPTVADDVVIDDTSISAPLIGPGVNAQAKGLTLGDTTFSNLLSIAGGGTLTTTDPSLIGVAPGASGTIMMSGPGSAWSSNAIQLGVGGIGGLAVSNGAQIVNSSSAELGVLAGSAGYATVTGTSSVWTNTGNMSVGGAGLGGLTITGQGQVSNNEGYIGASTGGEGKVTVSGTGSTWTNNQELHVGHSGDGTLEILDGGTVTSGNDSSVGDQAGSSGTVTISGPGSNWATTGLAAIGGEGTGNLTIENGGQFTNTGTVDVGQSATGIGTVTVTGPGSLVTTLNQLSVGDSGTGTLTVSNGGTIQSDLGFVGLFQGSQGAATITGAGSNWTTTGNFTVSYEGTGSLSIADQGLVDVAGDSIIGSEAGSEGSATVTGAGSTWTSAGQLDVGRFGVGKLSIADGGHVTNGDARIAARPGSVSEASVTGAGSNWTSSGTLFVGAAGTGTLTIADGGTVSANFSGIGADFSSSGMATVTGAGSTWNTANTLSIGGNGDGGMAIEDQAIVNVGGSAYLGELAAGDGAAIVTGAGSLLSVGGALVIGDQGNGTLAVLDGGKATSAESRIGQDGLGEATVSGANSQWVTTSFLYVGDAGTGTLNIADGALVVSGGSSSIGKSATGSGEVNVVDATLVSGGTLNIGSSGTGVLRLDNATVADVNGQIGTGSGSQGAVTVANGSTWTNSANLHVGGFGAGELTIESGGTVQAGNFASIATLGGSQGMVNIGAAAGDAPTAPGILDTPRVEFGDGDGTLVFNHTSDNYAFAPPIDGAGAIEALAGTTLLGADSGTFTGTATIHDGATLSVDGTLGGTLDVLWGGRLEGSGTAGVVNVAGTIAPGNSIGTLHVAGNYTQAAGSTYEVEIDAAGNSDLIDIAGAATLNGGTVEVVPFPDFALATPYTILTAAGGVTGTFDDASMASASLFLSPHLTYDANNAFFTIVQSASFDSVALTSNQKAAASGADSLGAGNPIWNAVVLLSTQEQARAAFDALSGEVHASARSVLIEDSRFVREAVDARLRAAFAGVGANAAPVLAYGEDGPEIAPADTGRFAAWGHAFGSWGQWDNDGNAASLTRDTGGFFLGGDMAVAETWRLGLLAGYSSSTFDIADRSSSGSAESYHLGAYAGTGIGGLGLRFGGAYSWHDVDTARTAAFPGFTDNLSARYDAATAQLFGEAAYRIDTAHASFEPFANLAYVNLHTDGVTETGGAAALTASSSSQDTTFTTLGLRAETALPLGGMTARLHGMLGWRHAFGDVSPTADLAFAGGSAFAIAGVPIAEDAAAIEAGLDLALSPNAKLGIAYNGQIGDGASDQGLKAQFSVTF